MHSFIFGKLTRVGDLYFQSEVYRTLDNADNWYNVPVIPLKDILVLIASYYEETWIAMEINKKLCASIDKIAWRDATSADHSINISNEVSHPKSTHCRKIFG